ncbi:MAG: ankyrin repeat domain-containing protein [Alphaproteobacteria bacterium]|nr:MAG: ankyrin repeat domain-containing protein [Alphaproteobacteria bacterium]
MGSFRFGDPDTDLRYAVNITLGNGNDSEAALMAACALLNGANPDIIVDEMMGYTALAASTVSGGMETINILLKNNADPNISSTYYGTPLTHHLWQIFEPVKPELVKLLLDHGARPDIPNREGKTALDYARERELPEIVHMCEDFLLGESGQKDLRRQNRQNALRRYLRRPK